MPCLQLTLLGPPEIRLDNHVVTAFESDKVRALLYYLAVETDHASGREHLAHLLWPEYQRRRGRQNLSQALLNLRRGLQDYDADPSFLHISRETLQFNLASDFQSDVSSFVCRNGHVDQDGSIESLETIAALYRGPFLSEFSIADADPFEEWMRVQRERLHRMASEVLTRILDWREVRNDHGSALTYARRLVALDPWHEEAHRRLIRLLALQGRRSEALRQYDTCVRILAEELSVQPTAATVALYERIREGTAVEAVQVRPPAGAMAAQPLPFAPPNIGAESGIDVVCVGREEQLARLQSNLASAVGEEAMRVVLVTGAAGQGKTTLLREFVRRARRTFPSLIVAGGNGSAYTGIGDVYAPFRSILAQLTGDSAAGWHVDDRLVYSTRLRRSLAALTIPLLARYGPDLVGTMLSADRLLERSQRFLSPHDQRSLPWLGILQRGVEVDRPASVHARAEQSDLFAQYTRLIRSLSSHHPLLLILDDLQWADPGSLGLLFHLGRQLANVAVILVGAYRVEEIMPAQDGSRHPLAGIVHELQRTHDADLIALGDQPDRLFIDELIDREPNLLDASFRTRLFRQTAGHPLFTVELLRGMQERGEVYRNGDGFSAVRIDLDWGTLPPKVEAVIAERLQQLPGEWLRLLQVAAVQGDRFVAELVAAVQGVGPSTVIRYLSEGLDRQQRLVAAQVSAIVGSGAERESVYRFRHHLYQQYLYENLDPVERCVLHERIGNQMAARVGDGSETFSAELAWHFEKAGAPMKAAHYLHRAGVSALRVAASQEGIVHLRKGIDLLSTLPDTTTRADQELTLQLSLGAALNMEQGHAAPEAIAAFERATLLAARVGATQRLVLALWNAKSYHDVRAEYAQALALGNRLLAIAEKSGKDRWHLIAHMSLGFIQLRRGELTAAHRHLDRGIQRYDPARHADLAEHHGADPGIACLVWAAHANWLLGQSAQADQCGADSLALAEELGRPYGITYAHFVNTALCVLRGDVEAAATLAGQTMALAEEHDFALLQAGAEIYCAWADFRAGETDVEHARTQLDASINRFLALGARIDQPFSLSLMADLYARSGRVADGLATIDQALMLCQERDERYIEAELHRLRGVYLLQLDDANREEPVQCFERAIAIARAQKAKVWESRAMISLSEL